MRRNDLYDAISGINKDYITESEDTGAVSAQFRKEKAMKKRIVVSALCLAFVGIGAIGAGKSGLLKKDNNKTEITSTVSGTELMQAEPSSAEAAAVPASTENILTDEPLYYSRLVKSTDAPEIEGYDDVSAALSYAAFDIEAFKEELLDDSNGMIEGEILDMWVNHYEFATASNKFEPNGRLYHKESSVAYKIRVDKVYSGDFKAGDEVTVEDRYFMLDSVVSIKKGGHYVIPIGRGDGKLWMNDEIVSGDAEMKSKYFTMYQFHPQIEKVDGGYIVTDDWKTLIAGCREVVMDVTADGSSYYGKMYYVPDDVFNERMELLIPENKNG